MVGLCGFLVCKPTDKDLNGFYWEESQQGGRDLGGDFIQKLQGAPLRVKLMADWTMNSCVTTATCLPETFPSAACQRSHHQSAIKGRTEGGKVK